MAAPVYTDADYAAAMQALMPRGLAWPRHPEALQSQLLAALAPTYTRQGARAVALLTDAFPVAPVEALGERESTLGLPDPRLGDTPTLGERQRQVAARFIAGGGQSKQFYIDYAAEFGFNITITEYTPSHFGELFGSLFGGDEAWAYAWTITTDAYPVHPLLFGGLFGEYFTSLSSDVLRCEMERLKPAHTYLLFEYTDPYVTDAVTIDASFRAESAAMVTPNSPFCSFSVWVRANGSGDGSLFKLSTNFNSLNVYTLATNAGFWGQNESTTFGEYDSANTINDDMWHHLFGHVDLGHAEGGKVTKLYVDGELANLGTVYDQGPASHMTFAGEQLALQDSLSGSPSFGFLGDFADIWIAPGQLVTDVTIFRDPVTGKPNNPATFPQAAFMLHGDATTFLSNSLGTEGPLTATDGALSNAATSPTD